jgi:hypothetical protein
VDAAQATLGEALLLLGSLVVVLFALIILLLEAKVILRLGEQLHRELGPEGPPAGRPSTNQDRSALDPEAEEERRDDAAS